MISYTIIIHGDRNQSCGCLRLVREGNWLERNRRKLCMFLYMCDSCPGVYIYSDSSSCVFKVSLAFLFFY